MQGNLLAPNSRWSGLPASVDVQPLLTPSGTGAPQPAQGAPSPHGVGRGKSDALSASAKSSGCGRRAAEVNGQQRRGRRGRGRMRRSQEIATEIRTFIAKGAGTVKVYVSSGRNGLVEKARTEIKAAGEVGGIKGGNLGEWSNISGKCPARCL